MTATEILAAARANPVGPYVPAREEWLRWWTGPVEYLDKFHDPAGRRVVSAYGAGGMANGAPVDRIRLALRRPECRDLLVRHGCPAWARDVPAAVWAAPGSWVNQWNTGNSEATRGSAISVPKYSGDWSVPVRARKAGARPRLAAVSVAVTAHRSIRPVT